MPQRTLSIAAGKSLTSSCMADMMNNETGRISRLVKIKKISIEDCDQLYNPMKAGLKAEER